ncbi:hypothetical protein OCGS_2277 [Oceaniovalibus guishaninsula JLT2003]|uniref:Tetratricopeptide repeat-like domain-containing protein n=1 Tax=Oceaniovalibus guishaninsula JLT2003 TaxID=1231392 RepID=K2I3W1_9RHOB|nr:hypothetical protein [Oceaniovalibus guishaninsula]EKE43545.1 hypothetical protein OCGS_2277 [Oceaniovalibus guishaninsula JLT2003]
MSNSDSFIDEVTEELRRDRLFAMLRRYGWIAVLVVLLLVGGAAFIEWRRAQDRAAAQTFGDAILSALEEGTPEARRDALLAIPVEGTRKVLLAMLAADTLDDADARNRTAQDLLAVSQDATIPAIYRELSTLKYAMLAQNDLTPQQVRDLLEPLTIPGAPYRLLAEEQVALTFIAEGDTEAAMARLQAILADDAAGRDLGTRARQLIVALGGTLDAV